MDIKVLTVIGGDVFNKIYSSSNNEEVKKPRNKAENRTSARNIIKRIFPNTLRLFIRDLRTVYQDYLLERYTLKKILSFKPDYIYERSSLYSTYGLRLSKTKILFFLKLMAAWWKLLVKIMACLVKLWQIG